MPEQDTIVEPRADQRKPVTLRTLRAMAARGEPFACLTAYDATTARWLERAGVPLLLVGDSAAEVILGLPRTVHMPLDFAVTITAAVKRGAPNTVVMADMPFMSYQADDAEGVRNAGRFMTEGMADIVKLEVDASFAPLVERMTRSGIPVCAHIGSLPQHAAMKGGYSSSGRTASDAHRIVDDAVVLQAAGAAMLLIEAVPSQVAEQVIAETSIPLIGIGAGASCHGQILVIQDLLGLTDQPPRFAEPVAHLGEQLQRAGAEWVHRVAARSIGGKPYVMSEAELDRFEHSRPTREPGAAPRRGGSDPSIDR